MIFPPQTVPARLINLPNGILLWLCFLTAFPRFSAAAKWDLIEATEWAQTKSAIDPEAGAEVILDETTFDGGSANSSEIAHHVRVRIYEPRGVEKYSKVEIQFLKGARIRKIEARTVTPDGGFSLLDPKDIYDREVLRQGNVRVKVKSFAPPGVVPNCIVEYRYIQERDEGINRVVLVFRREVPARRVHYRIRMEGYLASSLACLCFSCPPQELKEENGYYHFEMRDLPAEKEESFAPPTINAQPVIVLYLSANKPSTPKEYLKKRASELHDYLAKEAGNSRAIQNALSSIVAPTDPLETKIQKIYSYCRTKIINRNRENTGLTTELKKKLQENTNASDTLRQGNGSRSDINLLFAALARAAGADVRLALCNDRDIIIYNPKLAVPFMLTDVLVAVPGEGGWRYFDPGSTFLSYGEVNWNNSDTVALLSGRKEGETVEIAGLPPAASARFRVGTFDLNTDGSLEGRVVTTFTGLLAAETRDELDRQTIEERERAIRERLQATLKLAEVTDVTIENSDEVQAELKISYHLRIPEYAERTGSRMFFQPAVFQKNLAAVFASGTRNHPILFHYRYTEHDYITIQPPAGFTIEAGSNPGSLDLGAFASYTIEIGVFKKSGKIEYDRQFTLKALAIPQSEYGALKSCFDQIHTRDGHVLTLKQGPASTAPSAEKKLSDSAAATAPPRPFVRAAGATAVSTPKATRP